MPEEFSFTAGGLQKLLLGLLTVAVIAMASATLDHSQRLAVIESGPRGGEIITRLVTIETRLASIQQSIDDERLARRRSTGR